MNFFIEPSLRAALLGFGIAFVLFVARVKSARLRHACWTTVLAAMLLMPLLPYCFPAIPITTDFVPEMPVLSMTPPIVAPATFTPIQIAPAPAHVPDPPRPFPWSAFYFGGVLILLVRLLAGWRYVRQLKRVSIAVPEIAAYESHAVAAPVTIGMFRPRIVLPPTWREWPTQTLHAVLTHERAHVERRDPLIRAVALVNRCIFCAWPMG